MARPKASPNSYRDVIPMLEAALERGGAKFQCGTMENAIRMVQRMNQYRLITRRMNADAFAAAGPQHNQTRETWEFEVQNMKWHISPYDDLIIRRPINAFIIIERKPDQPFIAAYDLNDNPIDIELPQGNLATPWITPAARPTIQGGTTQAPREKHDPSKPLDLTDTDE